jgi:succinate dehydrogenase / fumarate reductase, cytochrome b subunit
MSSVKRGVLRSSILRKEVVAVSALLLTGFIFVHLAGVLLIFLGPDIFNGYTAKLHEMPELMWGVRIGLLLAFIIHVVLTTILTIENWRAQTGRYAVRGSKCEEGITFAKRTMIYTGLLIFFFVGFHLSDFTLADKDGPDSVIIVSSETSSLPVNLGLYGLVWKSFLNPWRAGSYILVMACLGLHLIHGIQSLFQSLGLYEDTLTPRLRRLSIVLGILVAAGFCAVPIFINILRVPPL